MIRSLALIAAAGAAIVWLYANGYLSFDGGADRYPIALAAVHERLSRLGLPEIAFPPDQASADVIASNPERIVWRVRIAGDAATRFTADLKAEGADATIVKVAYEGATRDLDQRLDSRPALRRAMVALMRENIAAALENRPIDVRNVAAEGWAALEDSSPEFQNPATPLK